MVKKIIFYPVDVTEEAAVETIFSQQQIDGVIHFAGLKAVGESVEQPVRYYYNNVVSTLTLCKVMQRHGVNKFVFSSSATVYGENQIPFRNHEFAAYHQSLWGNQGDERTHFARCGSGSAGVVCCAAAVL